MNWIPGCYTGFHREPGGTSQDMLELQSGETGCSCNRSSTSASQFCASRRPTLINTHAAENHRTDRMRTRDRSGVSRRSICDVTETVVRIVESSVLTGRLNMRCLLPFSGTGHCIYMTAV